jgi:hypothetical protein
VAALAYLLFQQQDLPAGTSLRSPDFEYSEARLLIDRTQWNAATEQTVRSHQIFDTILSEIESAETFVIADFFLWNPWRGAVESSGALRPLAQELAEALIRKRIQNPDLPILVITDPINRIYGDQVSDGYTRLAGAGIPVVFTDLSQMPDSNRVYVPQAWFWQQYLPAAITDYDAKLIPNPFNSEGEKLPLAQLGRMLYFKANHRKVLVTGRQSSAPRVLLGSFNPADGSANHSNVGALVEGAVAIYAAHSELDVAQWSSSNPEQVQGELSQQVAQTISAIRQRVPEITSLPQARAGAPRVAWRSEGKIQEALIAQLD